MAGRPLPLVEISSADPRERGRQYGEQARAQIHGSIAFYRQRFEHAAKLTWAEVQERSTLWVPLIEEYLPGIIDEVRGIAEGAGVAFGEILALNGRGELSYGNPFAPTSAPLGKAEDEKPDGCSSYAITAEASGDGHVYCGQNWDWATDILDTVVILRIVQPPKPTIVMQIEAGQVGRQGANSAGIALNANGLGGRFPGKRIGLPQTYIRRKALDADTMHDALAALFESKQSSCTNILLTHREGFVIDVETTPERHGWMYPTDGILVHANHFQAFVPEQIKDTYRPFSVDSLYRVPRIEAGMRKVKQAGSSEQVRETIAATLRDHFGYPNAVCNHPDERDHPFERTQTVASSIVDLTTGEYWAALGTPCEAEYQRLPWNIYDAAPSGLSTAAAAAAAATVASLSSGKDATGVGSRPDRAILAAG